VENVKPGDKAVLNPPPKLVDGGAVAIAKK
jgi:hypothetical protein